MSCILLPRFSLLKYAIDVVFAVMKGVNAFHRCRGSLYNNISDGAPTLRNRFHSPWGVHFQ
ncbi:hypothetical protein LSI01_13530 [Furfurilactobacillus siliginis]|uniref:Uncharacterized protein n=1 Tax=Furfurilactobacillus siliginis TaxID=348151 RepID=A0A510VQ13_9LACO|nr:hypothetical protein LSI01_13530 [Furfurilactobacillus siliginis]